MKKIVLLGISLIASGLIAQTALAKPTIESAGWSIKAAPGYENAYLFVKVDNNFRPLPRYRGKRIKSGSDQPLTIQGIVVKLPHKELGITCQDMKIGVNQKLVIGGKITVKATEPHVDFSQFTCKLTKI